MKFLLFVLGFSFLGLSAHAGEVQKRNCGDNMKQVQQIIKDDYPKLKPETVDRFIGSWGSSMKIEIDWQTPFGNSLGKKFKVCPQEDGTFFIMSRDPSENLSGFLRAVGFRKIRLTGFGLMVDGDYVKSESTALANGSRNY